MFDVVGIGLNAVDYLVGLPRFPVPGEKLRMTAFAREGGGQVATALVALSRWGCRCKYVGNVGDDEHGRLSSLLLSREEIFSPSIRIEALDTTGAGDIFHAGFLYALLEGLPFREILAFANAAAGLSCRGMGGRSAIPTIGEVRAASASSGR